MIGRISHVPVRLGETNNVACAGEPGVSNTYGSALWAIRLMLDAARAGIAGVNFHTLPVSCHARYSPFCAPTPADNAAGRFRVMPEWYALLFIRQLVGERMLGTAVSGDHPGLTVNALGSRSGGQVDVVLVNSSTAPATTYSVRLRAPALRSSASVRQRAPALASGAALWLTAPGLKATSGVKLDGVTVRRDGSWQPNRALPAVPRAGREYRITVPPASGVIVRLRAVGAPR
jgi:hypothetical protein